MSNILIQKGLQRDQEKKLWSKSFEVQGQGMVMNINGQQFQQPGERIHMEYFAEVISDGSIDDKPFSQINFRVVQGSDPVIDVDECIYYDEIELVKNIINQIFR